MSTISLQANRAELEKKTLKKIGHAFQKKLRELKQPANELSKGTLVGALMGAAAAPLLNVGVTSLAGLMTVAGNLGSNLLAGFVRDYYDAGSADARQAVIEKILQQVQEESEKSDQLLIGMQYLIDKIDAEQQAKAALHSDRLQVLLEHLHSTIFIPADSARHRQLVRSVRDVLNLSLGRSALRENVELADHLRADLLMTQRTLGGKVQKTVIQCVSSRQGRIDVEPISAFIPWLRKVQQNDTAQDGMIVTDSSLTPEALSLAETHGWSVKSYDDFVADQMDFGFYMDYLVEDFTESDSDMPPLGEYYVPLEVQFARETAKNQPFALLPYVMEWLDKPSPVQPLMLLGEYGTGKTTFSRKLACDAAQRYLQAVEAASDGNSKLPRPRIPILINLLEFTGKLDPFISHHLDAVCNVANPKFQLFSRMNALGLFLIILDGFDEMAVRGDSETIERCIENIETLASPEKARVILTGRPEFFMSREELDKFQAPRRFDRLSPRFKQYQALKLTLWTSEQIRTFLKGFVPKLPGALAGGDWKFYWNRIKDIPALGKDLAERAVLLEMIVKTLPDFDDNEAIDRPKLYERFLKHELKRQREKRGDMLIPDEKRFELLRALSLQTYTTKEQGITCTAAMELVKEHLPEHEQSLPTRVEQHTRDFLNCSFLRPDMESYIFTFSHRSFRGYFAAKELMERLIDPEVSGQPQPIDQDCITYLSEMLAEQCDAAFYAQQVRDSLAKDGIPDWLEKTEDGRYLSHLPGGFAVEMVYVPPGPYVLGGEGDFYLKPQIAILEKGFWIDKTPVTQAEYQHFLEQNPKHPEPNMKQDWAKPYNWQKRRHPKGLENHPVVLVSWEDAVAFCKWAGKALPHEQQWEKAVRGLDGRRWAWGNGWDRQKCNSASLWAEKDLFEYKDWQTWRDHEFEKKLFEQVLTSEVNRFEDFHSPYGLQDGSGNVWEWCENTWAEDDNDRVLRGGAWSYQPDDIECAIRINVQPDSRYLNIGFRCTRTR